MAYARDQARRDQAAALVREAKEHEKVGLSLVEEIVALV